MKPRQFNPFPEFSTTRLIIRRMVLDDAPELYFLRSDDMVMRYLAKDKEASVESTRAFIEKMDKGIDNNENILWGIAFKENPRKLVGTICLWQFQPENSRCEIGYVLHPDQWKKGIMKEAATAIIKYGWEALGLHSMEAHIDPENKASAALLLSLGFEKEAYFRENFCYNGKFLDTEIYGLINPGDKRGGESKTVVDTMPNQTNPS